ncbi:hypothetical protein [Burkholderia stagnalis]
MTAAPIRKIIRKDARASSLTARSLRLQHPCALLLGAQEVEQSLKRSLSAAEGSRIHEPGDEKRAVVILHPDDWEERLTTSSVEAARAMLQLYPAEEMAVGPKQKAERQI